MTPSASDSPPPAVMVASGAIVEARLEKPGAWLSPSDSSSPESVWTSITALGSIPPPRVLAAAL